MIWQSAAKRRLAVFFCKKDKKTAKDEVKIAGKMENKKFEL